MMAGVGGLACAVKTPNTPPFLGAAKVRAVEFTNSVGVRTYEWPAFTDVARQLGCQRYIIVKHTPSLVALPRHSRQSARDRTRLCNSSLCGGVRLHVCRVTQQEEYGTSLR